MISNKKKLIGFDLDGTLLDSVEPFFLEVYDIFNKFSGGDLSRGKFLEWVNYPTRSGVSTEERVRQFKEFFQIDLTGNASELSTLTADVKNNVYKTAELFPAAREVLNSLCEEGYEIALISSNTKESIQVIIDRLALGEFFPDNRIFVPTDTLKAKPEPDTLDACRLQFGDFLAYVGDTKSDFEAATAAKITPIIFTAENFSYAHVFKEYFNSVHGISPIQNLEEIPDFCKKLTAPELDA